MTNFPIFITSKKYSGKYDHSGLIFSDIQIKINSRFNGVVTKTKEYEFNVSGRTSNLS